jgi:hypothetical protein
VVTQPSLLVETWEERILSVARELKVARADIGTTEADKLSKKQLLRYRQARNALEAVLVEVPDA